RDRVVGYKLSPLLSRKLAQHLSAGRVQSVAVRLIVDREREIQNFKPEEYWKITALLAPEGTVPRDALVLKPVQRRAVGDAAAQGRRDAGTQGRRDAESQGQGDAAGGGKKTAVSASPAPRGPGTDKPGAAGGAYRDA